ncbi:uncharacterized protein LOC125744401 isoform X2 [Brienomyrus brachyistius]|nr:uncharacterized protein LOC125744401 isoform X2 [Brienomyrus brachyistius]XP_048872121.1 uncharacterized protein LOC125744401 isoform X2 [Brienomyrus brachyistius]
MIVFHHPSKSGFQLGQENSSPMQASTWTASGLNNPPLGPGLNSIPNIYQHAFKGGANGIHYTHVDQHQPELHTQISQMQRYVENGSQWNHQLPQAPTAHNTVTQANFRATASSLASRNQSVFGRSGPCTTLSSNGVQWRPSSSWYSIQNPRVVQVVVSAQQLTNCGQEASPVHGPVTWGHGQGKSAVGSSVVPSASTNYQPTGLEGFCATSRIKAKGSHTNGSTKAVDIVSAFQSGDDFMFRKICDQDSMPSWKSSTALVGAKEINQTISSTPDLPPLTLNPNSSFAKSSSNSNATCNSSSLHVHPSSGPNDNRQPHKNLPSNSSDSAIPYSSIFIQQQSNIVPAVLRPSPPAPQQEKSISNNSQGSGVSYGNFSNITCNSSSLHVQPSSGPNDNRQPHHNLPSTSSDSAIPYSSTFIQQQSNIVPAVLRPSPPAPQQEKSISNSSQGSGNLSHVYQNQDLPHQRLCQNRAAEFSALGQENDQASHRISSMESTNSSSVFAADPHTLKWSYSWPSKHIVKSCGQQDSGKKTDPSANQQRKEYYASVVEDRQRNPENSPSPSNTLVVEQNQMPIGTTEVDTTEVDSVEPSGRYNYQDDSENRSKCLDAETLSPACVRQIEFIKNQNKMSTSLMGMKAIAVVPPISQQSSTDQASSIANEDKECKIQTSFPDKSAEGNPESEANNSGLSHNVKVGISTVSSSDKSLCDITPEISTAVVKAGLSIQQSAASAENPAVSIGSSPPRLSGNKDQELLMKEDTFDLSTVPLISWTADKLRELIATLEDVSTPSDTKVEESSTPHIVRTFWSGWEQNLYYALNSNVVETIVDTWRTCTEDENPVIFSEMNASCKLAEKCLILGSDDYISNDLDCTPLPVNLCEWTDNVDKRHVNPVRPGMHITERENQRTKADEMEKCKVEEPVTDTMDVELLQKQFQTEKLGPLEEVSDPLSLLEIKVLSPTEARKLQLFDSQQRQNDTAEDPQTKHAEESILELKTKMSAAIDSDLNVDLEVPTAAAVASEQLSSKQLSQKLCRSESNETITKDATLETILKESTVKGMRLGGLQGKFIGTVSHSLSFHNRKKEKLMQKSKSTLPFQKQLLENVETVQKELPSSFPISSIKKYVDCSRSNQQKTLNGTKNHNEDSLKVPKLSLSSTCCQSQLASESKAEILRSERSQIVSVVVEGGIASLALYGSSAQRQKRVAVFNRQPDLRPSTSTVTGPPTKNTLEFHSQKRNLLEEGHREKGSTAKQKVYSSWEKSLVHQGDDLKSKGMSTRNSTEKGSHKFGNGDAEKPKLSSKIAKIGEEADSFNCRVSSPKQVSLVKINCNKYRNYTSMTSTVSSASKVVHRTDPGQIKSGMVHKKPQLSKDDEQLLCINGKKRKSSKKGGPVQASKKMCRSISSFPVGKSKSEIIEPGSNASEGKGSGCQAVVDVSRGNGDKEPLGRTYRISPDSTCPQGSDHTEALKTIFLKVKSHQWYDPNKDPVFPDAPSHRVGKSRITYEEYKKRYLGKAVK